MKKNSNELDIIGAFSGSNMSLDNQIKYIQQMKNNPIVRIPILGAIENSLKEFKALKKPK